MLTYQLLEFKHTFYKKLFFVNYTIYRFKITNIKKLTNVTNLYKFEKQGYTINPLDKLLQYNTTRKVSAR